MINGAAALAELIRPARDTDEFGAQRALPVLPELSNLLPNRGLRRGSTVAIGVSPGPAVHQGALPTPAPATGPRDLGDFERGARRDSPRSASGRPAEPGDASSTRSFASAEAFASAGSVVPGSARSPLRGTSPDHTERGATAIGSGSTSLLLALLAAASSAGSWCAVVGVPTLGALAAAESGIALDRLALVPNPGPEWPTVVAALIDGVDVVVIAVPGQVSASIASRLVARARQRGCVLVPYGRWDGADVTLQVTQGWWEGLGTGHGRLRRRKVTVIARGRGTAARPKEITMWMPGLAAAPPRDPAPGPTEPLRDPAPGSPPAPATPEPPRFRPVAVPPPASAAVPDGPISANPRPSRFQPLTASPAAPGAAEAAVVSGPPSLRSMAASAVGSGAAEAAVVSEPSSSRPVALPLVVPGAAKSVAASGIAASSAAPDATGRRDGGAASSFSRPVAVAPPVASGAAEVFELPPHQPVGGSASASGADEAPGSVGAGELASVTPITAASSVCSDASASPESNLAGPATRKRPLPSAPAGLPAGSDRAAGAGCA